MKKLVYLHELDSVRTSDAGILHGLKCLFEEVVKNGNYVALSMNQLADSKIIFSAIQEEENFNHILGLFEKGIIRISRYFSGETEIRTPAQYMLQSLEKNISAIEKVDSFITSALPIKHNDTELLQILRDAIKYSDPDSIRVKCQGISFGENTDNKNEIIEYLCTYVSFILSISKMQLAGNPPKSQKAFVFEEFMRELQSFDVDKWFADKPNIGRIYRGILTKTDCENNENEMTILERAGEFAAKKGINNRSNWHNYFSGDDKCNNASNHFGNILTEEEMLFAEMLVDLCYNYTVEESIENISLHYTSFEDKESLHADIKERILQYWREIEDGIYSPHTEATAKYIPYPREAGQTEWDTPSRVIVNKASEGNARIYEENYHKEQKEWSRKLRFTILRNIGIAIFYIIIFCISDILTGYVQDFISVLLNEQISSNLFFDIAINVGMFTILFAIVNSLLSKSIHLPDILESVEAIFLSVKDSVVVHKVEEKSYHRRAIEK